MRQILQPDSFGLAHSLADPMDRADSWETSWPRAAGATASPTSWWAESDEGYGLLWRLALAHLLVGVCVALALGWQVWSAGAPALIPAIGLIVAIGGALALLLIRLDRPAAPSLPGQTGMALLWTRLALVAVDLAATGGILWVRGGESWTLLALLPPVALAVVFFAERGGALATVLAALMVVGANLGLHRPPTAWQPSLMVFLGVAALIIAFLSIYSARVAETGLNLRWLLNDARATSEQLRAERQTLLMHMRAIEQARDALLQERERVGEASDDLTMLAQRLAQGDLAAMQSAQTLHPGAYGPLAELAAALAPLARTASSTASGASSWVGGRQPEIAALDATARTQGQTLAALDMMTRTLCVAANELVMEARRLEPGVSLIGSGQYSQALWQLEEHLRAQAAHMALLGTQIAAIRTTQENLEATLARAAAGSKTPAIFGASDIRAISQISQYSGPQAAFGASGVSAIQRGTAAPQGFPQDSGGDVHGSVGTVRWGDWRR